VRVNRRVTLNDVARECGLAPSTVSNALANKSIVTPATKANVLKVARELGYRVSMTARALRTNRSGTIGLLASDIANSFYADILKQVEEVAWGKGISLFLGSTGFDDAKQSRYITSLIDKQIDGLILTSHSLRTTDRKLIKAHNIPVVCLNRYDRHLNADFVGVDNDRGVRLALEHLVSVGHRSIGFVTGPAVASAANERLDAYHAVLKEHGITRVDDSLVVLGEYTEVSGREAAQLLLRRTHPPTAIYCANDLMALGVMATAHELGLSIPADLSVMGFDDIDVAAHPLIGLSTISAPRGEMGRLAATMLIERVEGATDPQGEPIPFRHIRLAPTMVLRNTVAAPKKS